MRVFLLKILSSPRVVCDGKRKKARFTISETMEKDVFCLRLHSDSQMDDDIALPKQTMYEKQRRNPSTREITFEPNY